MAEPILYYWPNIDLQAAIQLIVSELCPLTHAEAILNSLLWHVLVFFSKERERERVAENETITYFVHILSLVNDNNPSWTIQGKGGEWQYTIIDFNEVDIRIYLPEKVIIHRGR